MPAALDVACRGPSGYPARMSTRSLIPLIVFALAALAGACHKSAESPAPAAAEPATAPPTAPQLDPTGAPPPLPGEPASPELAALHPSAPEPRAEPDDDGDGDGPASDAPPVGHDAPALPEGEPMLAVLEPTTLIALEQRGYQLADRLGVSGPSTSAALRRSPVFDTVARTLVADLEELYARDSKAGVGLAHAHRLFDAGWLDSEHARFELVGLVVRLDRTVDGWRPAIDGRDTCGELRLVYRLAYTAEIDGMTVDSRLPMTVNLISRLEPSATAGDPDCRAVARRWRRSEPADADSLLADDGPLTAAALGAERLDRLEVNLQSIRWPSTVHPRMAGHAEYLMRSFRIRGGTASPAPLENTPDVERLARDKAARQELLDWLQQPETLAAVAAGNARMPEHLAAHRAVSVAPRGLARLANRPWRQLFEPSALAGLELEPHPAIGSPRALLRRLDTMTCAGCHHARSVAGFHLLGHERDPAADIDALAIAVSPHFVAEQGWRKALAEGDAPGPRPFSERHQGRWGERCGLGDAGFADWTCAPGLVCRALEDDELGVCVPEAASLGDPCEYGTMRMRADPSADRVQDLTAYDCADGAFCEANSVGFPAGMCAASCRELGSDGVCGGIPSLTDFNRCLARKIPFRTCIAETVNPRALRACDDERPCRDDYVCARVPGEPQGGACLPPYFLFQLRVDGHPAAR